MWSERPLAAPATLGPALRERVRFLARRRAAAEAATLAGADIAVLASDGVAPAPAPLVRAIAAGAVPVASRLRAYEELLADGERGLLFEPRDVVTFAAQLERLIDDPGCASGCERRRPLRAQLSCERVSTSSSRCTRSSPPGATTAAAQRSRAASHHGG